MSRCEDAQGRMAAALYEPLSPLEQQALEAHLNDCRGCRDEHAALHAFHAKLPAIRISYTGDLLPALREKLRSQNHTLLSWGRWAGWGALAACAVIAVAAFTSYNSVGVRSLTASNNPAAPVASPFAAAMAMADQLEQNRDFANEAALLEQHLKQSPKDPLAGQAQMRLADIEYAQLQRFDKAFTAYQTLRNNYNDTWKTNPENVQRLDLLAEARERNYEPLYALETAKSFNGDTFEALEKVVSRYPRTLVASLAVKAMRDEVGALQSGGNNMEVAALEMVRKRCTDPVAVAQLNVALGDMYWKKLNNTERAKSLYHEAAHAPDVVLAKAATEALDQLEPK